MIEYRGTPLFGEGSSISHTSEFFAIAGTLLFWLLFLIFSFVIKPQPKKPEYKEVQIVLESTPVVQKTQETPAPAEAASASASEASASAVSESAASAETPVREVVEVQPVVDTAPAKKTEPVKQKESSKPTAKKNETQKTQTSKTAPAAKTEVAEPIQYAVEPMEAFAAQTKKQQKKEVDWEEMFGDDESEENQASTQTKTVTTKNSISQEAAGITTTESNKTISSKNANNSSDDVGISENTRNTLKNIQESNSDGYSTSNRSDGTLNDSSSTGSIKWTTDKGRRLLNTLNENLISIDEMKGQLTKETPFKVIFSVDNNGHVIRSSVFISNSAMLTTNVKNEMIEHILKLEFTSGEETASAEFIWYLKPQKQ